MALGIAMVDVFMWSVITTINGQVPEIMEHFDYCSCLKYDKYDVIDDVDL